MPTYQYACTECAHNFEQVQSFSEDSLTECPECSGRLRKIFNSVGIVFKGSGFYRTDSRNESSGSSASSSSSKASSSEASTNSGSSSNSAGQSSSSSGGDTASSTSSSSGNAGSNSSSGSNGSSTPVKQAS